MIRNAISQSRFLFPRFPLSQPLSSASPSLSSFSFSSFSSSSSSSSPQELREDGMPIGRSEHFMLVTNNEDFRVEMNILNRIEEKKRGRGGERKEKGVKMMTVVGGGDTTLTCLMHPFVDRVVGIDMSENQIHLLYLKLAIARSKLSQNEALLFLNEGKDGKNIVKHHLAHNMPEKTTEFFLQNAQEDIQKGIFRPDNDVPFNLLMRKILFSDYSISLTNFPSFTPPQKSHFFEILESEEFAYKIADGLRPAFRCASWFDSLPKTQQNHIMDVVEKVGKISGRGLGKILKGREMGVVPERDFYIDICMGGGGVRTVPPWLGERGREVLREKWERLETMVGKIEDVKEEEEEEKFDLVTLSNCFDFMKKEGAVEVLKDFVGKVVKKKGGEKEGGEEEGGVVVIRRAVGSVGEILEEAGGEEVEYLEGLDMNGLFYMHYNSVGCARFK